MKPESLFLMLIINGITIYFVIKFLWKVVKEEK